MKRNGNDRIKVDLNWNRRKKFEQKWWHWFSKSNNMCSMQMDQKVNGTERCTHHTHSIGNPPCRRLLYVHLINIIYLFIFFSRSFQLCFLSLMRPYAQQCHRWIVRHSTKVKCTESNTRNRWIVCRLNEPRHSITDRALSLTLAQFPSLNAHQLSIQCNWWVRA